MKVKCEVDPPIKDVTIIEPVKTFNDGKVRFKLSAPLATVPKTGEGDAVGIDKIQLKFTLLDVDVGILELVETWNVKNNSNTNLKEVLDGLAVFIYDISDDEHNIGHTEDWSTDDNANKEFDVVQELFNQVVPRNRRVFNADNYDLMDENGIFDFKAKRALELFKEHFKVDNTTAGSDFKKLEKDYSFVDSSWANQIIGKKILMGKDAGDNQINASTDGDTGLYELYENVVKVFVNAMIGKGNEYAQDTKAFKDRSGLDRTGISYSFGSNDSRQEYRDVATSETFAPSPYPNSEAPTEYPTTPPSMQYHDYRGDVGTIDSEKQYAGLISGEFINWIQNHYSSCDCNCDEKDHHFFPQHWAGVDCSGFAMRIINAADPTITQNNGVPPININVPNIAEAKYECNGGVRSYSNRLQVGDFFVSNHVKNIDLPGIGDDERTRFLKLLKKGDLMHYDGHISIVYSDRTTDAGYYEIIHAYGITPYVFPGTTKRLFSRKVMVTRENIGIPTGFGRIKLWN